MKKILPLIFIISLTACSKVTKENYDKINVAMDLTEVEAILGSPDSCEEKTLHTNCVWGNKGKSITITLVSNKVTLYSSDGLE